MWLVEVIVAVVLPLRQPEERDQRARAVRQGHQETTGARALYQADSRALWIDGRPLPLRARK
jgi:hypothetical protein